MRPGNAARDRWLALGLLLAVVALAYALLVHPWWTVPMQALDQQLDGLRARDQRARAELNQATAISQRLQEVRAEAARRPGFMPQASAELATSSLVQRLEQVVLQASPGNRSCQISNRAPLDAPRGDARFQRVTVQVRLSCGAPELAAVLHSLEGGTPRLFVDNLNVLAQRFAYLPEQGGGSSGGLDASFDLSGYLQPNGVADAQR